jgi:hypothetical protein
MCPQVHNIVPSFALNSYQAQYDRGTEAEKFSLPLKAKTLGKDKRRQKTPKCKIVK